MQVSGQLGRYQLVTCLSARGVDGRRSFKCWILTNCTLEKSSRQPAPAPPPCPPRSLPVPSPCHSLTPPSPLTLANPLATISHALPSPPLPSSPPLPALCHPLSSPSAQSAPPVQHTGM